MANRRQTFLMAMGVETSGFRRGIREINRQLNSLKSTFKGFAGALGAGVGFTAFISSVKEVTVQLSTASATLKNVSSTNEEFASNQLFLDNLAKKYKQDIIALTQSFAQFHAAAEGTNMTLADQKKIYESLTRASANFHLSADRTNDMLLAVTQMMSKGKITAEELRRQLGNSLPGAFNKMAQAAQNMGLSKNIAEFENLMRQGKITSDVLVEFANVLDKSTQNIDLNSIQLQLNELKNTWTYFVKSADFESLYSSIIQKTNNLVVFLTRNIKLVSQMIDSAIQIYIYNKLTKALGYVKKSWTSLKSTFLGGGWIKLAVGGIITVVNLVDSWVSKLKEVKNQLKEISKIQNKDVREIKLYSLYNDTRAKIREYESDPNKVETYKKYKEYVERSKTNSEYTPVADNYRLKNPSLALYIRHLAGLAEIEKQLLELNPNAFDNGPSRSDYTPTESTSVPTTSGVKESDLVKALNKYQEKLAELNNQYANGIYTNEEYVDELNKLENDTWKAITAFGLFDDLLKQLPNNLKPVAQGIKDEASKNEVETSFKEYFDDLAKWSNYKRPKEEKRPTTFDYKKSDADIREEEVEYLQKFIDTLQDTIDNLKKGDYGKSQLAINEINQLEVLLKVKLENATDLEQLANVSQWLEDLKSAKKNVLSGLADGAKDVATAMERIRNGVKDVIDTVSDPDTSGWEKILAVVTTLASTFELITGMMETINTLKSAGIILQKIQNNEELKEGAIKAGLITQEGILKSEKIATAIASIFAGNGEIPIAGIAIAIAGVTAMIAGIVSARKYATGGIVGGSNYSGDKVLARVNSGEMILNGAQQKNLFDAVNNGFGGGNVRFIIKGKDLVGTIENYKQQLRG